MKLSVFWGILVLPFFSLDVLAQSYDSDFGVYECKIESSCWDGNWSGSCTNKCDIYYTLAGSSETYLWTHDIKNSGNSSKSFEIPAGKKLSKIRIYGERNWKNWFSCNGTSGNQTTTIPSYVDCYSNTFTNIVPVWNSSTVVSVKPKKINLYYYDTKGVQKSSWQDRYLPGDMKITLKATQGYSAATYIWEYSIGTTDVWVRFPSILQTGKIVRFSGEDLLGSQFSNIISNVNKPTIKVRVNFGCGNSTENSNSNGLVILTPQLASPSIVGINPIMESCNNSGDGKLKIQFSRKLIPGETLDVMVNGLVSYVGNLSDSILIENLYAGTYNVILAGKYYTNETFVYDESHSGSAIIAVRPPVQIIKAEAIPVNCYLGTDGIINLKVSGGTGNFYAIRDTYTSAWFNQEIALGGFSQGSYQIKIRDENQCYPTLGNGNEDVRTITINQPSTSVKFKTTDSENLSGYRTNNGHIQVTSEGGNGGYAYTWIKDGMVFNPTPNDSTALNIAAGKYLLMSSDSKYVRASTDNRSGCFDTITVHISQPDNLIASMVIKNPISCFGYSDGVLEAKISGGTAPYDNYKWEKQNGALWNEIQNGVNTILEGCSEGNYRLTVTDRARIPNISTSLVFHFKQPQKLQSAGFNYTMPSCKDYSDGLVKININGGRLPYSYTWNASSEDVAQLDSISAGFYSVSVRDSSGCMLSDAITISEPTALQLSSTFVLPSAYNASDGSIRIQATGGTGAYSYSWNYQNRTGNPLTALPASDTSYIATVRDAHMCEASIATRLIYPLEVKVFIRDSILCAGDSNGKLFGFATGGVGKNYTYQWFKIESGVEMPIGINDSILNSVDVGTYKVKVTDIEGNIAVSSELLFREPNPLEVSSTFVMPSSYNASDGEIHTVVTGGTDPYTYYWHYDHSTNSSIIGVPACDTAYKVTVTDRRGCFVVHPTRIIYPIGVEISLVDTIFCAEKTNGSLSAFAFGGVGMDYAYIWSKFENGAYTVLPASDSLLTGIGTGLYKVKVTDREDNSAFAEFNLTSPDTLKLTLLPTHLKCKYDTNGQMTPQVSGGNLPYSYLWSNGQTTEIANGLDEATHGVKVTDYRGCEVEAEAAIFAPDELITRTAYIPPRAYNYTDASAWVKAEGGVLPYTYSWEGLSETTDSVANLLHGTYVVTTKDANSCYKIDSIFIPNPPLLEAFITETQVVSCNGRSDGQLSASSQGGVGAHRYTWYKIKDGADIELSKRSVLSNIPAGFYKLKVTDDNDIDAYAEIYVLVEPAVLQASTLANNIACNGDTDGWVKVEAQGGTIPYTYSWSTGDTTAQVNNLTDDRYLVFVTDSRGCVTKAVAEITVPEGLVIVDEVKQPACHNDNTGSISFAVSGGVTPYTWEWNDGSSAMSRQNLASGNYTLRVTGANGCYKVMNYTIENPDLLTVNLGNNKILCNGQSVTLDASIPNGVSYQWTFDNLPLVQNKAELVADKEGTYQVLATNNKGCKGAGSIEIRLNKKDINSSFAVATKVETGQVLTLVNTNPSNEEVITWLYNQEDPVEMFDSLEHSIKLIFSEPDIYTVGMRARIGECEQTIYKNIEVVEKYSYIENIEVDNEPYLKKFSVYPNPSTGIFTVEVELKETTDIELSLYNMNGLLVEKRIEKGDKRYQIPYNISEKADGIYIIKLVCPRVNTSIKIIKGR